MANAVGSYYVEPNNWTSKIPSTITPENGKYSFNINVDTKDTKDPAAGCNKEFTASYKCGNSQQPLKTLLVKKNATGKDAVFDCGKEYAFCSKFRLILDNNGHLSLYNVGKSPKTLLWTNANDKSITMPESIVVDGYRAEKGIYGRNYLNGGEFLEADQWIGSTNGKYRLLMDPADNQLKVVYNKLNCDDTAGPVDSTSVSIYMIKPDPMRSNLGKLGYVDNEGLLRLYDDSQTGLSSHFSYIGGFNVYGSNLNAPISNVADATACQKQCEMSDKCAGLVFDSVNKTCQFKDKTLFKTGKRVINNNYQYYLRAKSTGDIDISCPSDVADYVFSKTSAFETDYKKNTNKPNMTSTTKCELAAYTENERTVVQSKKEAIASEVSNNGIKPNITRLSTTYSTIQNKLSTAKTSLKNIFKELTTTQKDLTDWSGDQLSQLEAMNEDRDLNMLSENYKHIMWSILAILIIMGAIKIAK